MSNSWNCQNVNGDYNWVGCMKCSNDSIIASSLVLMGQCHLLFRRSKVWCITKVCGSLRIWTHWSCVCFWGGNRNLRYHRKSSKSCCGLCGWTKISGLQWIMSYLAMAQSPWALISSGLEKMRGKRSKQSLRARNGYRGSKPYCF